jgi:hypothetical protein
MIDERICTEPAIVNTKDPKDTEVGSQSLVSSVSFVIKPQSRVVLSDARAKRR